MYRKTPTIHVPLDWSFSGAAHRVAEDNLLPGVFHILSRDREYGFFRRTGGIWMLYTADGSVRLFDNLTGLVEYADKAIGEGL